MTLPGFLILCAIVLIGAAVGILSEVVVLEMVKKVLHIHSLEESRVDPVRIMNIAGQCAAFVLLYFFLHSMFPDTLKPLAGLLVFGAIGGILLRYNVVMYQRSLFKKYDLYFVLFLLIYAGFLFSWFYLTQLLGIPFEWHI